MRQGFRDIISGWMLIDSFDDITERIEEAAKWSPLEPDEQATIKLMIEVQILRAENEFGSLWQMNQL